MRGDARGRHDPLRGQQDPRACSTDACRRRSSRPSRATSSTAGPRRSRAAPCARSTPHGKHLFLRFEGDLTLHSHLRMTGSWGVLSQRRALAPRAAARVAGLRCGGWEVVEFDGPVLELMSDTRTRSRPAAGGARPGRDRRALRRASCFLRRLRADDPTRPIGDALLDQQHGRRHRQPVEGRGVLRGRRRSVARDRPGSRRGGARARGASRASACAARRATASRRARARSTARADGRARAAARRSASAVSGRTTASRSGARAASAERAASSRASCRRRRSARAACAPRA